jgi:hypothetical protein
MLYEEIQNPEKFAMTNAISISALISLLIKKGVMNEEEILEEIRLFKEKILKASDRSAMKDEKEKGQPSS